MYRVRYSYLFIFVLYNTYKLRMGRLKRSKMDEPNPNAEISEQIERNLIYL